MVNELKAGCNGKPFPGVNDGFEPDAVVVCPSFADLYA